MSPQGVSRDYYCTDCRWLKMSVNFERGSNFICVKNKLKPNAAIIWRRPCGEFLPNTSP